MIETERLVPSVRTLTLKSVREMFAHDIALRPANKSANMPIIKLIDLIANDSKTITCEIAKGGTILNRGCVVECLIKLYFKDQKNARKYGQNKCDMVKDGVKYEIKYTSAKGYASYNPTQNYENTIFVNQYGAYLCNSENFILDNCKEHIKSIKINNKVKTLIEF